MNDSVVIHLPGPVQYILSTLREHGEEAYAVGGCVRDSLLHRRPNDWDVTTSASPETVRSCFRRTVATGIEHGTVTVMIRGTGYEVTTFRIDGKYKDNRHPEHVTFTPDLSEDLKRRDFTVNAMAYSDETGLVDLFGGREDLSKKVIRAVGDPEERFSEDALRIVRAVRFASQLMFEIDPDTYAAAGKLADRVKTISRERVREELLKTLESGMPEYVLKLQEIGVLQDFYPEFEEEAAFRTALLQAVPAKRVFRLSAFFRPEDMSGRSEADALKTADRVMDTLRFDNVTRKKVLSMLAFSGEELSPCGASLRKLLWKYGTDMIREMTDFHELAARVSGKTVRNGLHDEHGPVAPGVSGENVRDPAVKYAFDRENAPDPQPVGIPEGSSSVDYPAVRAEIQRILDAGECISLKMLAITGNDLISLGFSPGREMGTVLQELLMRVLEDPSLNTKEILTGYVKDRAEKMS